MSTPDGGDRLVNGRYRLIEIIGRGGMGTVWHGHDEMLDREVAIKEITLSPDLDDDARAELGALAMQEARATARLSHPGIITIFDVIEDAGVPIIVMELLDGASLADILKEQVRLPYRRVAEIGAAMLEALREAHAAGIVHRDLKPANVLVTDRRIVLTDFGVAQRVGEHPGEPGDVTGTPAFMAPEQAENAAASPAADLWALGATLFNAVEGRPPYQGPDYATVLLTLLTQEPPAPVRAGPLAPVITALLRKDPARRPAAEQVAEELAGILRDEGGPAALTAGTPTAKPSTSAPTTPPSPPKAPPPKPEATTASRPPSRIVRITPRPARPASHPKPGLRAGSSSVRPARRRPPGSAQPGLIIAAIVAAGLAALYIVTRHDSSGYSPSSPGGLPSASNAAPSSPADSPEVPQPSKVFHATALSPDGKTVAFGGDSGAVRLYDTATHKSRRSLKAQDGEAIKVLDFGPDGRSIAAETDGGTVEVWDLGTGKKPTVLDLEDVGDAMAFGSDGRTLTALGTGGQVAIWNLRTGKRTSSTIPLPTGALCTNMAVSPITEQLHGLALGHGMLAAAADGGGRLWSVKSQKELASWTG